MSKDATVRVFKKKKTQLDFNLLCTILALQK